jgi:hypothetical protein
VAQIEENNKYTEYAKWWEGVWMTCGRKETAVFESNSVAYTEEVIMQSARRNLMVWIYCLLRNYKKLTAIEDLELDVKKKMWAFVNEICVGKEVDVKRKKHICMVFYTIEYFINESNKS